MKLGKVLHIMANFGQLGPEGALAEEKLTHKIGEMPQKSVLQELGFYTEGPNGRVSDKQTSDSSFARACPTDAHGVQRMSETVFVEHAAQRWVHMCARECALASASASGSFEK